MIFAVSDLENPRLRRKPSRSSSRPGNDPLPRGLDPGDERRGRRIGKARQGWCRLMRETLRGEFGMPDGDFLEILDAPKIAVHADRAEIKRGNAERLDPTSLFQQ